MEIVLLVAMLLCSFTMAFLVPVIVIRSFKSGFYFSQGKDVPIIEKPMKKVKHSTDYDKLSKIIDDYNGEK